MGLHAFVHEHLPAAPARVLEVGCGRGDLARALARAGHRVVAIDPEAPDGDLFRTTTLEAFADPEAQSLERCLREWSDDHADLHGYAAMRRELDSRFTERFFTWRPYLYGELGGGVASEAEEQALIDAGAIQATGFRYVGERPATETT
jgi:Methyltransferase domain